MHYPFLEKYCLLSEKIDPSEAKKIGRLKHYFFPVPEVDIMKAQEAFNLFPDELDFFYKEIGFGFFFRRKGEVNCLLDPMSLVNVNLQLGYNKEDVHIQKGMQYCDTDKQLLFFKTNSLEYFTIDRNRGDKNQVCYKGKKVDSSLYDFLYNYYDNSYYLQYHIERINEIIQKEETKSSTDQDKSEVSRYGKKRIGGHRLIDPY